MPNSLAVPTPLASGAAPFARAWRHRELIRAILGRELTVRFRTSVFGWAWAVLGPLAMLGVYVLVFSEALRVEAAGARTGPARALSIFVGLILFNALSEIAYRSPRLLAEHRDIIRRSIFPPEVLAWVAVGRAGVSLLIALGVLFAGEVLAFGAPGWGWLLLPVLLLPFAAMLLGLAFLLSTIGALTSDLAHLVVAVLPVAMFATPVFYEAAAVAPAWQGVLYANPLTVYVEATRTALLDGAMPGVATWALAYGGAAAMLWLGYGLFTRKRMILVDLL